MKPIAHRAPLPAPPIDPAPAPRAPTPHAAADPMVRWQPLALETGAEPLECDPSLRGAHDAYLDAVRWQSRASTDSERRFSASQVQVTRMALESELSNANIAYEIQATAKDLEAQGAGTSKIMQETLRRAVELFELSPQCRGDDGAPDPQLVMDHAVAASARVLDGSMGIRSLDLALAIGAGDAHTKAMRDLTASFPADAFYPAKDHSSGAADLQPRYSDGTKTQASHTFNFVLTGYSLPASTQGLLVSEAGNVFHETIEGFSGATVEDYQASKHAAIAGAALRHGRDRGTQVPVGEIAPAVIAGTFSTDPSHYRYQINGREIDMTSTAEAIAGAMRDDIERLDPARGVVQASEWFWGAMRAIRGVGEAATR